MFKSMMMFLALSALAIEIAYAVGVPQKAPRVVRAEVSTSQTPEPWANAFAEPWDNAFAPTKQPAASVSASLSISAKPSEPWSKAFATPVPWIDAFAPPSPSNIMADKTSQQ